MQSVHRKKGMDMANCRLLKVLDIFIVEKQIRVFNNHHYFSILRFNQSIKYTIFENNLVKLLNLFVGHYEQHN